MTRSSSERQPRSIWPPAAGRAAFPLILVFLTALAVRLIHLWWIRASPFAAVLMGDARAYDDWARQIAGGDWIGTDVFYQAPLYPYFLGVIYAIAGRDLLVVRLIQAVIGSLSCVLLCRAGERLFSIRIGTIAGLMLALYAPAVFFDGLIQKSVLDVFLVCLLLYLIASFSVHEPSRTLWLGLGVTIGLLALTRENALVFAVVLIACALGHPDRARRLAFAGALILGVSLILVPVAIRNQMVGGGFFVTTSQLGPNFYIGNNPRADGTYMPLRFGRGSPEYEREDATELAEGALGRRLTPALVSRYWTGRALAFITAQPARWLRLMARKLALLANATEMLDTESQYSYAEWSPPIRLAGSIGHFGILLPLAVLGVWIARPERRRLLNQGRSRDRRSFALSPIAIVLALAAAYAASVVSFYVFARYRFPLVPFLVLFAAAGLVRAPQFFRGAPFARVAPVAAAVAAAAVFANWPLLSVDVMRAITETNLAVALQADGLFDQATDHYRRAVAIRPDYAPAYNNWGAALRATGRAKDALDAYQQAIGLAPEYPEAHYNAGNALLDLEKPGEAAEHFRRALQLAPGSVDAHNNLGIALAQQGQAAEAIGEFRAALALDGRSVKAHRNLGDALAATGNRAAGVEELRRAIELEPSNASVRYDLGSMLLEIGNVDEAIAELEAALRAAPEIVEIHNNLGIALASRGRVGEAIAHFQEALRIQPGFEDARRNLALAEQRTRVPPAR